MKEEVLYSAQEVADILKINKNTVYNMIKRGELVAYKVGNKMRVSDREIDNYKKRAQSVSDMEPSGNTETRSSGISEAYGYEQEMPAKVIDEPVWRENGFIICGQDTALDAIANQMQNRLMPFSTSISINPDRPLRSYIGSYNGLYMLYQGQVSVASVHLWDGKTNTYNIPYVEHMLPGIPTVIFHLLKRTQGFYVKQGNPKNIRTWEDLKRPDITFANREKGSGTRILLDEKMRQLKFIPNTIKGYSRECFSHLAVAGIIARGGADVGLGTQSGAQLMAGLDFIPLQQESYDIVIRREDMNRPMFRTFVEVLRSTQLRMILEEMEGYDLSHIGEIISET